MIGIGFWEENKPLFIYFGDTLKNYSIQGKIKNRSYESIFRCGNPK